MSSHEHGPAGSTPVAAAPTTTSVEDDVSAAVAMALSSDSAAPGALRTRTERLG